jgi:hypothetical protein
MPVALRSLTSWIPDVLSAWRKPPEATAAHSASDLRDAISAGLSNRQGQLVHVAESGVWRNKARSSKQAARIDY